MKNTSNPKFWAVIGFIVGGLLAFGGKLNTPLDALLGAVLQGTIWFGVSSLVIRRNKKRSLPDSDIRGSDEQVKISTVRAVAGGFFFFSGLIFILGVAFKADGAPLGAGVFNLLIGTPLFWPVLHGWLNKLGKR